MIQVIPDSCFQKIREKKLCLIHTVYITILKTQLNKDHPKVHFSRFCSCRSRPRARFQPRGAHRTDHWGHI